MASNKRKVSSLLLQVNSYLEFKEQMLPRIRCAAHAVVGMPAVPAVPAVQQ